MTTEFAEFGPDRDPNEVPPWVAQRVMKTVIGPEKLALARFLAALMVGPCTIAELTEASGMCEDIVRGNVRAMWVEQVLHVVDWEQGSRGRRDRPVFALGPGKDARKPLGKTNKEVKRETRARNREFKAFIERKVP